MAQATPILHWHRDHGGKLVEFAGWELPVMYGSGIISEHLACRRSGGLFDITHMGRFVLKGPGAADFLNRALTCDASSLEPGAAKYGLISDEQGRPLDDIFLLRPEQDEYLLIVNGANRQKDWEWLSGLKPVGVEMVDATFDSAMFALQGPKSAQVLGSVLDEGEGGLPPAGRNRLARAGWQGVEVLISRTGYTGDVGFELIAPWQDAPAFWRALYEAGAPLGVVPVGLGARDTLRLEAALPLYGHELRPEWPIMSLPQARFGVSLAPGSGDFVGRAALEAQASELQEGRVNLVPRQITAVAAMSKGMMRDGSAIMEQGREVGLLTSGTTVPAWRFEGDEPGDDSFNRAIGLAYLDRPVELGQEVEIRYRKRVIPAKVVKTFVEQAGDYLRPLKYEN